MDDPAGVNAPPPSPVLDPPRGDPPGAQPERGESAEDKRRRQAQLRATRAAVRAAARAIAPERAQQFAHLDLAGLRAYRTALAKEEDKVSYWRRILQARLDTVREGLRASMGDLAHLAPVLAAPRVQSGRVALVTVVPSDDVPPLPDLARLWELTPDPANPADAAAVAELTTDLVAAESELSSYRAALHRRLDAATTELIARYREDPRQCLVALPLGEPGD